MLPQDFWGWQERKWIFSPLSFAAMAPKVRETGRTNVTFVTPNLCLLAGWLNLGARSSHSTPSALFWQ